MTDQKIYERIEETYNSEKGKSFISHLIRSFLPMNRAAYMLENTKNKSLRCALTGMPVITKADVVKFQLENMEQIIENLKDLVLGNTTINLVAQKFKGKYLAIECENSDKILSVPAFHQLLNFSSTELLKGNKHINYLINDERTKEVSKNVDLNTNEKKLIKKVANNTNKRATFSLSELDALKDLKRKLENK